MAKKPASSERKRNTSVVVERRRSGSRRQSEGPIGERYSTADEIAFMKAMDRYKRDNHRPFPTWSEVLAVLRSLGYRRGAQSHAEKPEKQGWEQLCESLKEERGKLHLEVAVLEAR